MLTQAEQQGYFQFPISALELRSSIIQVSDSIKEGAFQTILGHCLVESMDTVAGRFQEEQLDKMADDYLEQYPQLQRGNRELAEDQRLLVVAAKLIKVSLGSLDLKSKRIQHSQLQKSTGRTLVRIRSDIFWSAKDFWSWRDFAVLCAVYGGCGCDPFRPLSYERIGCMAIGYSSIKERDTSQAKHNQLTDRQVRRTVETLEQKKLFVRASPNRRHVYYSNRLSLDELMTALAARGVERTRASQLAKTAEIKSRLLAQLSEIAKNEVKNKVK